ncbi:hypothetical protein AMTR_s00031p00049710 [Amborella trichopoda]|uniref:Uncharacterized protein n=1 Tax=Amborella trichopoda TaxID=13333 RepID=U5D7Y6_AMBTC|nr:hypothetical protein AMTR_s00031p00049710 [Amborella trichopoda]
MSSDSDPCPWESTPSYWGRQAKLQVRLLMAITVQGEELRVNEASEPHEAIAGSEVPSSIGEEEPVLIEQLEEIVPDNRDEDVGDEGLNASEGEGPDETSEQPVAVALDGMAGVVRDEGPSIAPGEEADPGEQLEAIIPNESPNISQREELGTDGRLEHLEAAASNEALEAPVLGPSEVEARLELEESSN